MNRDQRACREYEVQSQPTLIFALNELTHLRDNRRRRTVRERRGFGITAAERFPALIESLEQFDRMVQVFVGVAGLEPE